MVTIQGSAHMREFTQGKMDNTSKLAHELVSIQHVLPTVFQDRFYFYLGKLLDACRPRFNFSEHMRKCYCGEIYWSKGYGDRMNFNFEGS